MAPIFVIFFTDLSRLSIVTFGYQSALTSCAWMQEVEQRMEQLPRAGISPRSAKRQAMPAGREDSTVEAAESGKISRRWRGGWTTIAVNYPLTIEEKGV